MDGIPQIENTQKSEEYQQGIKQFLITQATEVYGLEQDALSQDAILDIMQVRGQVYFWTIAAIVLPNSQLKLCTITQPADQEENLPTKQTALISDNKYIGGKRNGVYEFISPVPISRLTFKSEQKEIHLDIDLSMGAEAQSREYRFPNAD